MVASCIGKMVAADDVDEETSVSYGSDVETEPLSSDRGFFPGDKTNVSCSILISVGAMEHGSPLLVSTREVKRAISASRASARGSN